MSMSILLYSDHPCHTIPEHALQLWLHRFALNRLDVDLFRLLAFAFGPPSALHTLGLRPIDMVCRDPALIVCLCASSHGWSITSDNRHLIGGVDFLGLA